MKASRLLIAALLVGTSLTATGCTQRAISNMQTLLSHDCGVNWEKVEVGKSVPAQLYGCDLKVSIPNYPMAGDAQFRAPFKGRVLVNISVSYEYTITDPMKFIQNARYLGRQNSAGDGQENAADQYETAENLLIDRRMRDVASEMLRDEDVVTFESGPFEDKLLDAMNKALAERGITLNSIAFTPTPDVQTRQAIDAGAAMRVYEAIGLQDLGRQMMVAKAGASTVTVTNARDNDGKDGK